MADVTSNGAPDQTTAPARWTGHTKVKTTKRRYVKPDVEDLRSAAETWGGMTSVRPRPVRHCGMWERERVSESTPNTLQYRSDGPEGAPVLVLGPALGTTWHRWAKPSSGVHVVQIGSV
ncbi:hypothetical protein GCM10020000_16310 [Streptomyces olivoverticillatus]